MTQRIPRLCLRPDSDPAEPPAYHIRQCSSVGHDERTGPGVQLAIGAVQQRRLRDSPERGALVLALGPAKKQRVAHADPALPPGVVEPQGAVGVVEQRKGVSPHAHRMYPAPRRRAPA